MTTSHLRNMIITNIMCNRAHNYAQNALSFKMGTTDRVKAVPLSSPLFNECLTCIFNELMYDWRYACVCVCMSVLCLRGGCIFCVTFPALAFSYLFSSKHVGS